jgi:hypothetical protein
VTPARRQIPELLQKGMKMSTRTSTKGRVWLGALIVMAGLGLAVASTTAGPADPAQAKPNKYIGSNKCKSCHANKENGDQHGTWLASKHAKAFTELASDAAKKAAADKGIADPQTADACIKCHTTGHGLPKENFDKAFDIKLGVQCETCHGPGEKHMKARFAAAAALEEGKEAPKYTATPEGEIILSPKEEACRACHNKDSPTYKPFCFPARSASLRHLLTNKPRTPEQLKELKACGCGDKCSTAGHECTAECAVPDPKVNK